MTHETREARFERDLRSMLLASEPAAVPAALYGLVDAIPRPEPAVLAPRPRGWDRRALAVLAVAAVLAIVAVGIGSGIVRLPGILPLIGGPSEVPGAGTYRLYYKVTPLDRHAPTADEVQRALDVLRARVAAYQGTASGEVLTDIPDTVAVDVTVPADDPGRLEELRAMLPMTSIIIGTVTDGTVEVGGSTDDVSFEPAFGNGTAITPTLRADGSALDLVFGPEVATQFADWARSHAGGTAVVTVDGVVTVLVPITVPAQGGSWTIPFTADEVAAGFPRRLLALFSSGSLQNPVSEVAPRGVQLAPGITPEPEPTAAPTVAPGQGLRIAYRVLPFLDEPSTPADLAAILDIMAKRVLGGGAAFSGANTGADTFEIGIAVPAHDAALTASLRRLLGATGLVEFVPLGDIGLEGGLIDPAAPRLFAGNLDPVTDAEVAYDQDGNRMVQLTLDTGAASEFATWSAAHVGELFAIVVDGEPVAVPSIGAAIPDGVLQVSSGGEGGWPEAEAADLVALLDSGRLPHPVEEISTNALEPAPTPTLAPMPTTLSVAGYVAACPGITGCVYDLDLRGVGADWRAALFPDANGQLTAGAGLPATLEPGDYTLTATVRRNPDSIAGGMGNPGPVDATCTVGFSVAAGDDVLVVSATFDAGVCEVSAGVPR